MPQLMLPICNVKSPMFGDLFLAGKFDADCLYRAGIVAEESWKERPRRQGRRRWMEGLGQVRLPCGAAASCAASVEASDDLGKGQGCRISAVRRNGQTRSDRAAILRWRNRAKNLRMTAWTWKMAGARPADAVSEQLAKAMPTVSAPQRPCVSCPSRQRAGSLGRSPSGAGSRLPGADCSVQPGCF